MKRYASWPCFLRAGLRGETGRINLINSSSRCSGSRTRGFQFGCGCGPRAVFFTRRTKPRRDRGRLRVKPEGCALVRAACVASATLLLLATAVHLLARPNRRKF